MTGRAGHLRPRQAGGQAAILLVGGLCATLIGALVLAGVGRGIELRAGAQRTADLAAVAGARALLDAYPRLFDSGPRGLTRTAYLAAGRAAAERLARVNGARDVRVSFPDARTFAPVRVRVRVSRRMAVRRGGIRRRVDLDATAEAELAPQAAAFAATATGPGYAGPLAHRQGRPMRPDVARAFDRLAAAARADGVALIINSAYRSDAEQAVLWARNPDPRWVAPPGRSLHRYGTELDLGPPSAHAWLRANAGRFHFVQRYAWEPWHWGYVLNPRSRPGEGAGALDGRAAAAGRALPAFVPGRFASALARAAQRWNVSAALLAAQLHAESNFNPLAVSPAGARGIAQFMPGTARQYGLRDPFDAPAAIDAQARLMRDLLRRFTSVPLALAAYNAGPAPVAACMCVPAIPETRGYVARILGLLDGSGDPASGTLEVRLVG